MGGQNGRIAQGEDNWGRATADHDVWLEKEMNMMMAPLITGMAFQVGVNPPDGLWKKHVTTNSAGKSKIVQYSFEFSIRNTLALLSSLSIIFLLITGLPISRRSFMRILRGISLFSISCIAVSYFAIMQYLREIEGGHGQFDGKDNPQFPLMIVWFTAIIFILLVRVTPAKWRIELFKRARALKREMCMNACYESGDAS